MNRFDIASRILVVAVLTAAMSVFMRATPATLAALILGGAMVVFGSIYSYRQGAMMGVVVVAIGAASSVQLDSLSEVRMVLTAVLGLLLPLFLLALHALGTEPGDTRVLPVRRGPTFVALAFCLVCVLSAPIALGGVGLILPTLAVRLSGTSEVAIVLLTAAIGSILLTRNVPAAKSAESAVDFPDDQGT